MSLPNITSKTIQKYQEYLESLELSESTVKRKLFALRKFCSFLESENLLSKNPFVIEEKTSLPKNKFLGKLKKITPKPIHHAYRAYSSLPITKYINTALLLVFSVGLGIGLYTQLTGPKAELASAYPTSLTTPKRYLSFQGRLTDTSGNPISVITDFKFDLYNVSVGGTSLWTGSCNLSPDQDGIFSTKLGSDCGSEVDSSVFTENQEIWLEITVGTSPSDETLTPRIQIATVGYALNAETLQGYPPASPATANTIPIIDSSGNLVIGSASPTIQSTSGTFAIEGAVGLILQTASGSDGNITLAPDGDGLLNLTFSAGTGNAINATNSNIGASGGKEANTLFYGYVGNDSTNYNLLKLESGSSKSAKFTVDNAGNASASGILKMFGAGNNYFAGNVGIGTSSPSNKLSVSGNMNIIGNLGIGTTSPGYKLDVDGDIRVASGSDLYVGTYGLNDNADSNSGSSLVGLYDDSMTYVATDTTVQGAIKELDTAIGGVSTTAGGWTDGGTNVYLTTTSDNVGIGTTAPSARLEINAPVTTIGTNQIKVADGTTGGYFSVMEGSSGASVYLPMFTFASAGINGFGGLLLGGIPSANDVFDGTGGAVVIDGRRNPSGSLTASNILNVRNNGASKMVVTYDGNVGIGTTNPTSALEISAGQLNLSGSYAGSRITMARTTGQPSIESSNSLTLEGSSNSWVYLNYYSSGGVSLAHGGGGIAFFSNVDPGSKIFNIDNGDFVVNANTGNVGIGTTSPTSKLHVVGDGYFSTNLNVGVGLTTPAFTMVTGAGDGKIFTSDSVGNASWSDITSVGIGGSGTTNYLPKFTAGTVLGNSQLFDNSTFVGIGGTATSTNPHLYINAASGNVGIGTTSPDSLAQIIGSTAGSSGGGTGSLLHLKQNTTWSGAQPWALYVEGYSYLNGFRINAADGIRALYKTTAGGSLGFAVTGDDPITFTQSNTTERMRIDSGGNVGIGTTAPDYNLHVNGANGSIISVTKNTDDSEALLGVGTDGGYFDLVDNSNVTQARIRSYAVSGTQAYFLAGNIGIGTSAPSQLLHVAGNMRLTGALYDVNNSAGTSGQLLSTTETGVDWIDASGVGTDDQTLAEVYAEAGNAVQLTAGNGDIRFYNDAASEMLFLEESSGNVGIGTTNPGQKLSVIGPAFTTDNAIRLGVSEARYWDIVQRGYVDGSDSDYRLDFYADDGITPGVKMSIEARTGNVGIGTTGPAAKLHISQTADVDAFRVDDMDSDTTPFIIDSAGRVGIGTGAPATAFELHLAVDSQVFRFSNVATGLVGDSNLGEIQFYGDDNSADRDDVYAKIRGIAIDPSGAGSAINGGANEGGGLAFYTAIDSSGGSAFTLAEKMRIDTTGNVGIGTTGPGANLPSGMLAGSKILEIQEETYDTGIILGRLSTVRADIWYDKNLVDLHIENRSNSDNSDILFRTKTSATAVDAFVIKGSGNVGIGTTGPGEKLEVFNGNMQIGDDANSARYLFFERNSSRIGQISTSNSRLEIAGANDSDVFISDNAGNGIILKDGGNVGIGYADPGTAKLAINGNVGIGTASPAAKLEVVGNIRIPVDGYVGNANGAKFGAITGGYGVYSAGTNLLLQTYSGSAVETRLFINAVTGNIGIGTTSPLQKLQVAGDINIESGSGLRINNTATSGQYLRGDGTRFVSSAIQVGDLPTITAAGGWTDGGSDVFLTASADNVGIGTSSPSNKLSVSGNMNVTGNLGIGTTNPGAKLDINTGATNEPNILFDTYQYNVSTTYPAIDSTSNSWIMSGTNWGILNGKVLRFGTGGTYGQTYTGDITAASNGNGISITGNVGIGTTGPYGKLDISGSGFSTTYNSMTGLTIDSSSVTGGAGNFGTPIEFTTLGGANYKKAAIVGVQNDADIDALGLAFFVSGSKTGTASIMEGMRIDYLGNVGIGTTEPGAKLDIAFGGISLLIGGDNGNTTRTNSNIKHGRIAGYHYSNSEEPFGIAYSYSSSTDNQLLFGGGSSTMNAATILQFYTASNNTTLTGTERMRIDSSGNVGIGTTAPTDTLTVWGNNKYLRINSDSESSFYYARFGEQYDVSNALRLYQYTNQVLGANSLGTSIFLAPTAGNVGIGTTNPLQKLQVAGDINIESGSGLRINNTATSGQYLRGDGTRFVSSAIQVGDLPAITAAGGWTDGGSDVYLTTTSDNVGIGTSSPSNKLSVSGNMNVTGNVGIGTTSPVGNLNIWNNNDSILRITANGDTGGGNSSLVFRNYTSDIYSIGYVPGVNGLQFSRGGSVGTDTTMILGTSGLVGIGTTGPATNLEVVATGNDEGILLSRNNIDLAGITSLGAGQGEVYVMQDDLGGTSGKAAQLYSQSGFGHLDLLSYSSGAVNLRLDGGGISYINGGNVGIGTTDPDTKLEIYKAGNQLKLSYDANSFATFAVDASDDLTIKPAASGGVRFQPTTTDTTDFFQVLDQNGGTPILNVDTTNERVGIGTTSPLTLLNVHGNAGSTFISVRDARSNTGDLAGIRFSTNGSGLNFKSFISHIETGSNGLGDLVFVVDSAADTADAVIGDEKMRITSGGNVGIGTTNPLGNLSVSSNAATTLTIDRYSNNAYSPILMMRKSRGTEASPTQVLSGDDLFRFQVVGRTDVGWSETDNDGNVIQASATQNWTSTAQGRSLQFLTVDNDTVAGDIRMTIDQNGNVGIGVTDPSNKLSVTGNMNVTGNLGIGTTAPNGRLHVKSASSGDDPVIFAPNTGTTSLVDNQGLQIYWNRGNGSQESEIVYGAGSQSFLAFTKNNAGSFTESLRIDSGGNVGIGTTAPSQLLHVAGNMRLTGALYDVNNSYGTSGQVLSTTESGVDWIDASGVGTDDQTLAEVYAEAGNAVQLTAGNGDIRFYNDAASEMLFLDESSGRVGIGTTAPDENLHVYGTDATTMKIESLAASGVDQDLRFTIDRTSTDATWTLGRDNTDNNFKLSYQSNLTGGLGTGDLLTVDTSGNVGIGTTNPTIGKLQLLQSGDVFTSGLTLTRVGADRMNMFLSSADNVFHLDRGETTGIAIESNGDVGIGTSAPSQKLHVAGNMRLTGALYDVNNSYGTSGQVLSTTESGIDWIDASGVGTDDQTLAEVYAEAGNAVQLTAGNGDIRFYNDAASEMLFLDESSGNVGIGTTGPNAKLDIQGGDLRINQSSDGYGFELHHDTTRSNLEFEYYTPAGIFKTPLVINYNGNVGIGTTSPGQKLEVVGGTIKADNGVWTTANGLAVGGNAPLAFGTATLRTANDWRIVDDGDFSINRSGATSFLRIKQSGNISIGNDLTSDASLEIVKNGSTDLLMLSSAAANDGDMFIVTNTGNVGIGTTSPSEKLDVAGKTKTTTFQMTSGANANYILQSDASGNASWIDAAGAGIGTDDQTLAEVLAEGNSAGSYGIDMNNQLITNIGNAGTDFTSGGGLTLAENLTVTGGTINLGADVSFSRGATNRLDLASGDSLNLVSGSLQVAGTEVITSGRLIRVADGTASAPSFSFSADTNTGFFRGGTDILGFTTAGSERLRIDASGNIGIGTTSPSYKFQVVGSGDLLSIGNTAGTNYFSVTDSAITSNLPHSFTASGDVSMAYDLYFTNSTASYIKSSAPLYIEAGETYNSSDLTLRTYNAGNIILDSANLWADGSNVGIGTTSPSTNLHVAGGLRIQDELYDSANSAGSNGMVLTSTGVGTTWSAVSSLSVGNADTLDSLDSLDFLRATDDDTFEAGNTLTIAGTMNATGNAYFGNYNGVWNSSGNVGIGTTSPDTPLHIKSGSGTKNYVLTLQQSSGTDGDDALIKFRNSTSTTNVFSSYIGSVRADGGDGIGHLVFGTNAGSSTSDNIQERMRITTDGNVGIGTTGPGAKLEVAGNVKISSSGILDVAGLGWFRTGLRLYDNQTASFGDDGDYGIGYNSTNDTLQIVDGSTINSNVRISIDNNGNVGIGTTVPSSGLKLDVEGKTGATEYCDEGGNNCYDASESVTVSVGGTITNFYPVFFTRKNTYGSGIAEFILSRASVHEDVSNQGSFFGEFKFGAYNWGHTDSFLDFNIRSSNGTYGPSFVANPSIQCSGASLVLYLRGASTYHFKNVRDVTDPVVYLTDPAPTECGATVNYPPIAAGSVSIIYGKALNYPIAYSSSQQGNYYISNNVGIGVKDPDSKLEVYDTGTQLKLSYDANSFATFAVDASDDLTIKPAASGGVRFQPTTTDTTDFFQVLDQNGGTPILNVDATNERVGIGTTAPASALGVNGDITLDSYGDWIGSSSGDNLTFKENSSTFATILNSTASNYFNIDSNNNDTNRLFRWATNTSTSSSGSELMRLSESGQLSLAGDTDTYLYNLSSNTLSFVTGGTETLTMKSGSVGIGTTSPTSKLHVETTSAGDQNMLTLQVPNVAGNNSLLNFGVKSAGSTGLTVARIQTVYDAGNSVGMSFWTYGTSPSTGLLERMRISNNGNVGIGTTSPGAKLEVAGVVKITGGSPGASKVLTSDANGLASWTTIGSGSIGDLYLFNTGDTGTGAYTFSGGAFNVNASSNYATNINTGTSTGALSLGGGSGTVAINSTSWDVTTAGVASGLTGLTSSGTINFSGLTASRLVTTDASKNLASTITLANLVASVSDVSGSTGTTNLVLSASPTFTGTVNAAALTLSGTFDPNGAITLPTTGISGAGSGSGLDADLLDGLSSASFLQTEALYYYNADVGAIENASPQYWILTRNGSSNDVNGRIRIDRTSGNSQAASVDIVVTSNGTAVLGGSLTTNQYTQQSETYRLVTLTLTADGLSYVAIEYTGNTYPKTISRFTGHLRNSGGNTFTAVDATGVSVVTALPTTNSKHTFTGNVGIGTTSPGAKLDVNGAIKLSGTDNIILNGNYLSGDGGDEGVFVGSTGRVGIGTTLPQGLLNVDGDYIWITNKTDAGFILRSGDSSSNGASIQTNTAGDLVFTTRVTSNSERMRILGNGNVGIGTTNPTALLDVAGEIQGTSLDINGIADISGVLDLHNGLDMNNTAITNINWAASDDGSGSGLDADLLDGYNSSMTAGNSTVAVRNASGYLYANYFNTTANVTATAATHFAIQTSSDNFIRWQTPDNARASLGLNPSGTGDIWVEKAGDTMTGTLTMSTTMNAAATTGSIVLSHPTSYQRNSVVFASRVNYGSDYGYIEYRDDDNDSGEAARLTIGTSNDADDDVVLDPSGRLQILATNVTLDVSGNLSLGSGTITSGLINGQTISSAANFTGSINAVSWADTVLVTNLNADLLDTIDSASFLRSDVNDNIGSDLTLSDGAHIYRNVNSVVSIATPIESWSGGSGHTGAIYFVLPNTFLSSMMTLEFDGYQYSSDGVWKVLIGGYAYSPGDGSWVNYNCQKFGSIRPQVRLGSRISDNRPVIIFGDDATVWSYPKITLTSARFGHNAPTSYLGDWESGTTTTVTTLFDTLATPDDKSYVAYSYDSDKLDGYHGASASTVNTYALRDASGDINTRLFRSEYDSTNATIGYIMTQVDTVSNNYIRPSTPAQLKAGLGYTTGSGTDNYIPRWNGTTALENSIIYDNGTNVGIGTTSPTTALDINGDLRVRGNDILDSGGSSVITFDGSQNTSLSGLLKVMGAGNNYFAGNVGIGTTAPSSKLEVSGTITLTNASGNIIDHTAQSSYDKIRVWNSSLYTIGMINSQTFGYLNDYAMTFTMNPTANRGFLWRDSSDTSSDGAMSLTTDGRLYVKSTASFNGNVGIGTTNPGSSLEIYKPSGNSILKVKSGNVRTDIYSNSTSINMNSYNDSTSEYEPLNIVAEDILLKTGTAGTNISLYMPSSGNVGIGSTDASRRLTVSEGTAGGNVVAKFENTGATSAAFSIVDIVQDGAANAKSLLRFATDNGGWMIGKDDARGEIFGIATGLFGDLRNTKFAIDTSGNVGIGTTSPAEKLEVNGTIKFSSYATGSYQLDWGGIYLQRNTGSNTIYSNANLSNAGTLATGGSAGNYGNYVCSSANGSGSFGSCSSSREYKENINYFAPEDYDRVLDEIQNINIASYTMKDEEDSFHHIGIIAEESPSSVQYIDKSGNVNVDFMSIQTGYTWAGIKALANYADKIDKEVKDLSQTITTKSLETSSFDNLVFDLDEFGNIIIEQQSDENFVVKINEDKALFEKIIAANIAFFADLKTGIIESKKIISDKIETKELVSPIINSDEIETKKISLAEISPLAQEDIIIDLERPAQETSKNSFGKLIIKGENGNTVASIDASGSAEFTGKLESDSLETNNATISGTLTVDEIKANRIQAEQIIGFEGYFDSLLSTSASGETIDNLTDRINQLETSGALSDEELALSDEIEVLINEILSENTSSSTASAQVDENIFIPDYSQTDEQTSLQSLTVYGSTSLADTTISGYLSIDGTLVLSGNSIDSLSDTLYINPMSLASINIMAGQIIIDTNGNAIFKKNLTVEGTLAANEIAPLENKDVLINLANSFDEQASTSGFGKLLVKGEEGNITASIDASGSAKFASLSLEADYSATESGSLIAASETEKALGVNIPSLKTNASTGIATLPKGETKILIYNRTISNNSLIYITPATDTGNKVLYVEQKKAKEDINDGWFIVSIDQSIDKDIKFNWWIVN